jgi:membrane protease YdiL (CAAX protease family)
VLSEKQWKLEAVLLLGTGLMMSLSIGVLVTLAVRQLGPEFSVSQERFMMFIISSVSFQGAGLVLTHFFLKQHEVTWTEFLGLKGPNLRRAMILGFAVVIVALPLILGLNEFFRQVITRFHGTPDTQPTMQVLELSVSLGQRIVFGITAMLLAPMVEEVLFRGILYRAIKQYGYPRLALFGTALLFGAIHLNWMTFFPLAALAVILALLYDRTNNLMAPIFAHSLFNAVNFFSFIYREELERWFKQLQF